MATLSDLTDQKGLFRGADLKLQATMNPVVNISGWALTFTVKEDADDDLSAVLTKTVGTGITITDGAGGKFEIVLTEADTETLKADKTYDWDIWRTDSGSKTPLAYGRIAFKERVTE